MHVSRFVSREQSRKSTCAMLDSSVVEWLWLIELLSVLGSHLVCVQVELSVPTCRVPQGRVHCVSRAIVNEGHSWTMQIGLVCDVSHWLEGSLAGELFISVS